MSVGSRAEKFNIVSNDLGRKQMCDCTIFDRKYPFMGKFGPKIQNCLLKVKFGVYTNSVMQSSMLMFTFYVFGWKYPIWTNLVQEIKIFSLS